MFQALSGLQWLAATVLDVAGLDGVVSGLQGAPYPPARTGDSCLRGEGLRLADLLGSAWWGGRELRQVCVEGTGLDGSALDSRVGGTEL